MILFFSASFCSNYSRVPAAGLGSRPAGRVPDDGIRSYGEGAGARRRSGGGTEGGGRGGGGACGPDPGTVKAPLRFLEFSVQMLSLQRSDDPPPSFLPVKIRTRPLSRFPAVGATCALCFDPFH